MLRVVFWNVGRRRQDVPLAAVAGDTAADVLILIEPPKSPGRMAPLTGMGYMRVPVSDRFVLLTRPKVAWRRLPYPEKNARVEFWELTPDAPDTWVFAVVHGHDRRNVPQDGTRAIYFRRIVTNLVNLEPADGPRRTILLGDLNANPFEPSVMGAAGFHALGTRTVRGRTARPVRGAGRQDFFYNPTWRLYGADPAGDAASATYFHHRGDAAAEPMWHMLDQVLVRPEVADRMPADQLRIVTSAGVTPLTTSDGRPNAETASDHLPVTFLLT